MWFRFYTILFLLFLTACEGIDSKTPPPLPQPEKAESFTAILAREYQALSQSARSFRDTPGAKAYGERAKAALKGAPPTPLIPDLWRAKNPQNLHFARGQLIAMLGENPSSEDQALAQVGYDCWVLESYKRESKLGASCRQMFYEARARFESEEQLESEGVHPHYDENDEFYTELPQSYLIFFKQGGLQMDKEADDTLSRITDVIEKLDGAVAITLIGHTDSHGEGDANQTLSEARALKVEDALRSRSTLIDFPRVDLRGAGESEPLVITAEDAIEPLNRRVEVVLY